MSWFRVGKSHDKFEQCPRLLAVLLDRSLFELVNVAADAILLLGIGLTVDQEVQEVDDVHTGNDVLTVSVWLVP